MREILFRGKRIDNGEWVEGYYVCLYDTKGHKTHRIYTGYAETDCGDYYPEWFEVVPETVGQYVCNDKNGKRVFEGDIVHVHDFLLRRGDPYYEFDGVVGYRDGSFVIVTDLLPHYQWLDYDMMVIGNIHDNPERLEVEHE